MKPITQAEVHLILFNPSADLDALIRRGGALAKRTTAAVPLATVEPLPLPPKKPGGSSKTYVTAMRVAMGKYGFDRKEYRTRKNK